MNLTSNKYLSILTLTAFGLVLMGCQQAPPAAAAAPATTTAAPAPTTSSESSSSTRSVEVKTDAASPDTAVEKTVTKDSSTTKQQQ